MQGKHVLAALGAVSGLATGLLLAMVFIYFGIMGEEPGNIGAIITAVVVLIGLVAWGAKGAQRIGGRAALIITCVAGAIGGLALMGIQYLIWNTVEPSSGVGAAIGGAVAALTLDKKEINNTES